MTTDTVSLSEKELDNQWKRDNPNIIKRIWEHRGWRIVLDVTTALCLVVGGSVVQPDAHAAGALMGLTGWVLLWASWAWSARHLRKYPSEGGYKVAVAVIPFIPLVTDIFRRGGEELAYWNDVAEPAVIVVVVALLAEILLGVAQWFKTTFIALALIVLAVVGGSYYLDMQKQHAPNPYDQFDAPANDLPPLPPGFVLENSDASTLPLAPWEQEQPKKGRNLFPEDAKK